MAVFSATSPIPCIGDRPRRGPSRPLKTQTPDPRPQAPEKNAMAEWIADQRNDIVSYLFFAVMVVATFFI